ncbi:hypothetical protein ACJX0J_020422, partial [Zea mays]
LHLLIAPLHSDCTMFFYYFIKLLGWTAVFTALDILSTPIAHDDECGEYYYNMKYFSVAVKIE